MAYDTMVDGTVNTPSTRAGDNLVHGQLKLSVPMSPTGLRPPQAYPHHIKTPPPSQSPDPQDIRAPLLDSRISVNDFLEHAWPKRPHPRTFSNTSNSVGVQIEQDEKRSKLPSFFEFEGLDSSALDPLEPLDDSHPSTSTILHPSIELEPEAALSAMQPSTLAATTAPGVNMGRISVNEFLENAWPKRSHPRTLSVTPNSVGAQIDKISEQHPSFFELESLDPPALNILEPLEDSPPPASTIPDPPVKLEPEAALSATQPSAVAATTAPRVNKGLAASRISANEFLDNAWPKRPYPPTSSITPNSEGTQIEQYEKKSELPSFFELQGSNSSALDLLEPLEDSSPPASTIPDLPIVLEPEAALSAMQPTTVTAKTAPGVKTGLATSRISVNEFLENAWPNRPDPQFEPKAALSATQPSAVAATTAPRVNKGLAASRVSVNEFLENAWPKRPNPPTSSITPNSVGVQIEQYEKRSELPSFFNLEGSDSSALDSLEPLEDSLSPASTIPDPPIELEPKAALSAMRPSTVAVRITPRVNMGPISVNEFLENAWPKRPNPPTFSITPDSVGVQIDKKLKNSTSFFDFEGLDSFASDLLGPLEDSPPPVSTILDPPIELESKVALSHMQRSTVATTTAPGVNIGLAASRWAPERVRIEAGLPRSSWPPSSDHDKTETSESTFATVLEDDSQLSESLQGEEPHVCVQGSACPHLRKGKKDDCQFGPWHPPIACEDFHSPRGCEKDPCLDLHLPIDISYLQPGIWCPKGESCKRMSKGLCSQKRWGVTEGVQISVVKFHGSAKEYGKLWKVYEKRVKGYLDRQL